MVLVCSRQDLPKMQTQRLLRDFCYKTQARPRLLCRNAACDSSASTWLGTVSHVHGIRQYELLQAEFWAHPLWTVSWHLWLRRYQGHRWVREKICRGDISWEANPGDSQEMEKCLRAWDVWAVESAAAIRWYPRSKSTAADYGGGEERVSAIGQRFCLSKWRRYCPRTSLQDESVRTDFELMEP